MQIVKIAANSNGSHDNQTGNFSTIPDGFAIIPPNLSVPVTFPFVDITVENGVVTEMTANQTAYDAAVSAASASDPPTAEEQLRADVDYIAAMTGVML